MIYEKKQNEGNFRPKIIIFLTVTIVGMMEKKYQNPKFFDQKDTEELVATYTYGRGLTPLTTTPRRPEVMNQQMNQQRMNQNAPIGGGPMGNMPGKYFIFIFGQKSFEQVTDITPASLI